MKMTKLLARQNHNLKIMRDKPKKYLADSSKKLWRRYIEAQCWSLFQGEACKFYYAWGLNAADAKLNEFISRREFLRVKERAERNLARANQLPGLDYQVLTKDKFITGAFLAANAIPCIHSHGIVLRGKYVSVSEDKRDLLALLSDEKELFFKNVLLEASEGVLYGGLGPEASGEADAELVLQKLMTRLKRGTWLVQSRMLNHASLRKINSSALNSTRIVTITNGSYPQYLAGFQAFATGSARTDSWDKGAIYVGIDIIGQCLKSHGYYNLSDKRGSVVTSHPDSGVLFKGFAVPLLSEAVALCIKAHRLFYNNFVIGWDVAITDQGPVIVEANEKPGMNVAQCVDGGLRKKVLASYEAIRIKTKEDR